MDTDHVKYIVDKIEKAEVNKREPFKPYKTTKSNVHDPMKEKQRKKHKNWEVTAATPPLIVHEAARVLSLNESLRLQKEQTEKLQVSNTWKTASIYEASQGNKQSLHNDILIFNRKSEHNMH